jgi:hypothetical protein
MEARTSTRDLVGGTDSADTTDARDGGRFEREPDEPTTARAADERRDVSTDTRAATGTADLTTDDAPELLPRSENEGFQGRWETIQTGFVDEPRQTVEQADELVAEVMRRLAEGFADERERLETQWGRGEDVSTEDLRIALQRYRGFFQRLLSA